MFQTFIDLWGKNMVINNLCVALNDVDANLEISRTTWPPFTLIPVVGITPRNLGSSKERVLVLVISLPSTDILDRMEIQREGNHYH